MMPPNKNIRNIKAHTNWKMVKEVCMKALIGTINDER